MGRPSPWPNGAFIDAAAGECSLVESSNRRAVRRHETDRAAVGDARRLAVGRLQHEEFRSRFTPDRAVLAEIVQAFVAERTQHVVIECAGLHQIIGADRDVREYGHRVLLELPLACFPQNYQVRRRW